MLVQFCYSQLLVTGCTGLGGQIYRFQITKFENLLQDEIFALLALFDGETPMTDEFPAQKACNAEIMASSWNELITSTGSKYT